ncbi:MAG: fructose-bisphosphate aldolase [Alphaproteobacteria bacterium]|nr:fructose-bisphosphate aldolase [Alphaproteobacteria bacterium]
MSEIGKARRLAHMFNPKSNRMFCLPMDHGMQVGPLDGIRDPGPLLDLAVDAGVDSVIVTPGILARYYHRFSGGPSVILRIDQSTNWRFETKTGYPDAHIRLVATAEEAVQMGCEAVITYLFTCNNRPDEESRSFEINGRVATECRKWGLVHVIEAMAAKGGFVDAEDPDVVAMNCRIAGELGADIIKTDWCAPERFKDIAKQSLAPVAAAGGPALPSLDATTEFARTAIEAGSAGLIFGRNVFLQDDIGAAMKTLGEIIHG